MKIVRQPEDLPRAADGVCLALGVFDGVHLGHQAVIADMIGEANRWAVAAVVVTFDRHPNAIVAPSRTPRLIQTLHQRLRALTAQGPAAAWVIEFDQAFSEMPGEAFVRRLGAGFGRIRSLCVGEGFHFGHHRSGNVARLRDWGAVLGFETRALAPVWHDGALVSSTRIREAIASGDLRAASRLLGRPYALAGTVVRGDGLAGQWGFPTANLDAAAVVLPPRGVYAVRVRWDERLESGVMNIGTRPTVATGAPNLRAEVHLFNVAEDLYGRDLEVTPLHQLRAEQRFASVSELRAQIGRDAAAARHWIATSVERLG